METNPLPYQAGTNENLFGASAQVQAALQQALSQVHAYPQPDAATLRRALASTIGVQAQSVVIGSGSAELISLLVRRFCGTRSGGELLTLTPSYPLYRHEADALGVSCREVPLTSALELDVEALLRQLRPETRLCFLCNPNNPTGTYLRHEQLEHLLAKLPAHVVVAVDEAYIEYATAPDCAKAIELLPQHPNLVVLRTFSKAYGLASLRIGYLAANPALVEQILAIKQPYNVNQLAQVAALAALEDTSFLEQTLVATQTAKAKITDLLRQNGVQTWPSQGNFLYLDAGVPAQDVHDFLLKNHLLTRQVDAHTIRLTVGPDHHQDYLARMLTELLAPARLYPDKPLMAQVLQLGASHTLGQDITTDLEGFVQQAAEITDAEGRTVLAFARALAARNGQDLTNAGNLYASSPGTVDMIAAFNVLVNATPLVTFGHRFANHAILQAIAGKPAVYLLDLGIGSGLQWLHLFELVAALPGKLPTLHLTGIDIPDTQADNPAEKLAQTGLRLAAHAAALGLAFSYTCVATRLEDFDLSNLEINEDQTVIVNAALALHHLHDGLTAMPDQRDRVLRQVLALRPALFTLTEPDTEHNRLDFLPRLRESLRHYHTVFDVLHTLLPADMPERRIIEQEFFGREIANVVAGEGSARVERHERRAAWQNRLRRLGFEAATTSPALANTLQQELHLHPDFTLAPHSAGYTLHWRGTNIIAATAWQPAH